MGKKSKWEYFRAIYPRYRKASSAEKTQILEEFCEVCGYNRKYAITKLNGPFPEPNTPAKRHKRGSKYTSQALLILQAIWEASGYPWSVRLKRSCRFGCLGPKNTFPSPHPSNSNCSKSLRARSIADSKPEKPSSNGASTDVPSPAHCSNTISPSKPTPGTSPLQALPKPT